MTQQADSGRTWQYRFSHDGEEIHRAQLGNDEAALELGVALRQEHRLTGDLVIEREEGSGWRPVGTEGRARGV
jgi:hypothetical protein